MSTETLIQPKYRIGQKVFAASGDYREERETCPDCLGKCDWEVTTPAGDAFHIPCGTCHEGYFSVGTVRVYRDAPVVHELTIGSVRMDTADEKDPIDYQCRETGVGTGRVWYERLLFTDHDSAMAVAVRIASEAADARRKQQAEQVERERKKSRSKPSWEKRTIKDLEVKLARVNAENVALKELLSECSE